ncbi:hypothetical protein JW824_03575 [bacterium]|nr:hypothetical protein [bacterium]
MEFKQIKLISILTIILALSLGVVSYFGTFVSRTYERDATPMAVQGMGQDIVDLFLVVPLLLGTLVLTWKHNKASFFLFGGTVFYILYSFFIYAFGVHFNELFLLYCLTLGTSLYLFILIMIELNKMDVQTWFSNKIPVKTISVYLIVTAIMFYMLWFKDIVPAVLTNTIPDSVADYDLLVNPVHVIDISFALPGLIITAILLFKKQKLGFILTPIFLIFIIMLAIALIGMVVMLKIKGINDTVTIAIFFIIMSILSTVLLIKYFKTIMGD